MKIAILSESAADEAAVYILSTAVLDTQAELVPPGRLRSRGWPSVLNVLPATIKHLHYHTDADGLIVVVDSDNSPVHQPNHDPAEPANQKCRLCHMRNCVAETRLHLSPIEGRKPLNVALGLAVPAVEAWYRFGLDSHVGEANWVSAQPQSAPSYGRQLKKDVYGTDRPSTDMLKERGIEQAERIVKDNQLAQLEQFFPGRFGSLVTALRAWPAG